MRGRIPTLTPAQRRPAARSRAPVRVAGARLAAATLLLAWSTDGPARRNTARLLPYHRLDIGMRRRLRLFGADAEFYLQIFNVYSRRNEWFVQYDADSPDTEPEVVKQLPVVPTFGLEFAF